MRKVANCIIDIILSLVRTRSIGYLRDIRRLTVALSRARLGLYILGRRSIFSSTYELKPAFDILFSRPDSLTLVTEEMYGSTTRLVDQKLEGSAGNGEMEAEGVGEAVMEGVEHLGKYVYEMTKAKVEALKQGGAVLQIENGESKAMDEDADADLDRPEAVLVDEYEADDGPGGELEE